VGEAVVVVLVVAAIGIELGKVLELFFVSFWGFETQSRYLAQAGLKLKILLPQFPRC
jgi:hypothetical protein